ncbi:hypothetical protein [Thalassospira xiamenensis]|jgi:hypothetical protein|uniref:hypothetical protein n=1 Tax=Thalassospira xiamenensis TaxID=220697 RepID=UPI0011BDD133|nr:hypothetical protein [Thalassospira xiamenensis]
MRKFTALLPLTLLLGACWFDNAPELYKVDVEFSEPGGSFSANTSTVCDFRGQTSTRTCEIDLTMQNHHLELVGAGRYAEGNSRMFRDPQFELTEYAEFTKQHIVMPVKVLISAHGRKENRYGIHLDGLIPYGLNSSSVAKDDLGRQVAIATDESLRKTYVLDLTPMPEEYLSHWSSIYNEQFNREFSCYNGDPGGCKLLEQVAVSAAEPFKPATLTITWTPIDEDDLSRTDQVS